MATAAVLFINPDIIDTVRKKMNMVNHLRLPPFLARKSTNTSKKPVFTNARLNTNIAPIVITALLLNPLIACSGVIILKTKRIPVAVNAVTSSGTLSSENITTEHTITSNNITASGEILIFTPLPY